MERKTTEKFIEEAIKIHGDRYDYSLVEYVNSTYKVKIICKKHGVFEQHPNTHRRGGGCPSCKGLKKKTLKDFIDKSNKIYQNKYDYSLIKFKDMNTKVQIICPIHGIFEQKPKHHLSRGGCYDCGVDRRRKTLDKFIEESIIVHNDKYVYDLVDYKNARTNVKIICKHHGVFEQIPDNHLNGCGCPVCKESKGEKTIGNILDMYKIRYVKQKKFKKCQNIHELPFDFYLPELNICVEYDGIHHFESILALGGDKRLKYTQNNDKIKNEYCKKNNIHLIRIKYNENIKEKIDSILFQ